MLRDCAWNILGSPPVKTTEAYCKLPYGTGVERMANRRQAVRLPKEFQFNTKEVFIP